MVEPLGGRTYEKVFGSLPSEGISRFFYDLELVLKRELTQHDLGHHLKLFLPVSPLCNLFVLCSDVIYHDDGHIGKGILITVKQAPMTFI